MSIRWVSENNAKVTVTKDGAIVGIIEYRNLVISDGHTKTQVNRSKPTWKCHSHTIPAEQLDSLAKQIHDQLSIGETNDTIDDFRWTAT